MNSGNSSLSRIAQASSLCDRRAFTLIELLVVISIIGLLAALVIPLSGIAATKMRIARTRAELNNYVTAIETYKLQTGEYPPDNGALKNMSTNDPNYHVALAMNPLFYELTGAVFTNRQFLSLAENTYLAPQALQKTFNVGGIRNSARVKTDIDYKGFSIKDSQHVPVSNSVDILVVPVPSPAKLLQLRDERNQQPVNPWYYDASSTNRHNLNGFDLWAEINTGNKEPSIIGNWRQ